MAADATPSPRAPSATPPRALSPHLQIWRFTPTMAASITQRATGAANYSGTILIALWIASAAVGGRFFDAVAGFIASPVGVVILVGYVWSLSFHMLGGLRYLYTDTGRGLAPKTATRAALAVYAGSVVLTAIVAAAALAARGA